MVHEGSGALDAGVGEFADLLAVEAVPLAATELLVEVKDELGVDEVDEGVAHVAGVELVNGKIEEVYLHFVVLVDLLQQHVLAVLVRDVSDHQRRSPVRLNLNRNICTLLGRMRYY